MDEVTVAEILMLLGDKVVEVHKKDKEIKRLNGIIDYYQKQVIDSKKQEEENG